MFPLFTNRCLHVRHDVRDPSSGSGNCGRECCPVILPKWQLRRHLGIFYMPQIYDMGPTALLPLQRKACWGFFFALKNPTASAGFEPANLGTKGQHATPRPPKPLHYHILGLKFFYTLSFQKHSTAFCLSSHALAATFKSCCYAAFYFYVFLSVRIDRQNVLFCCRRPQQSKRLPNFTKY